MTTKEQRKRNIIASEAGYADGMAASPTTQDPRPFDELTESEQEPYHDKAAEILSNLHWCTRVWEAWNVGTMTRNDFVRADEDDDIVGDAAKTLYDFVQALRKT